MKKALLSVLLFLLISGFSRAVITDLGLDPLDQTCGARPLGMGGAFIGISDDLNSLFYNPAGLAGVRGLELSVKDIKNYSFGVGYETRIGTFGLGVTSKNYDGFNGTTEANYEHSLILAGYGVEFGSLSIGFSFKSLLSQRFSVRGSSDIVSKAGYDEDIGILWKPVSYASLGLVQHNIGSNFYKIDSSEEAFPKSTKAGVAIAILGSDSIIYNDTFCLKLAADLEYRNVDDKDKQNSFYGMESSFYDWIFVRLGASSVFVTDKNVDSSSFGLGFKFRDTEIDFATLKDPVTEGQISFLSVVYYPSKPGEFQMAEVKEKTGKPEKELLVVASPADDYATYDETIAIEGKARPGASVSINGVSVYLDSDGAFKAVQSLNLGKNLIEIEAGFIGEKKIINRKVLRKAKVVIAEEEGLNKKIVEQVLSKEAEINKKEKQIQKDRKNGIDVSAREKALSEEKGFYEARKAQLYAEKKKTEERKAKVENLATLGVVEVSPDKSFAIEAPIKRGEMISWLVKSAGLNLPKVEKPVLNDVPESNEYAPFIMAALDAGYIKRPADNKFRPDDPVTEEEGQEFFKAFGVIR